jgi:hypothetical protein
MKLSLLSYDCSIKHIIVALYYLVYLPAVILVGDLPDWLISLLFIPLWRFEVGYFFLWVVVELLLQERLVLHVFLVKILRSLG